MASTPQHQGGPILSGGGIAWVPAEPDDPAPARAWVNARAFPAVWRDSLRFSLGGVLAAQKGEFQNIRPGAPWDHRPDPDGDADVDQAIAAKLHLAMRTTPLLAAAQVVVIEPEIAAGAGDWDSDEELGGYAAATQLPESPLFLDCEGTDGTPLLWEAETWPLPFNLRGSLMWQREGVLAVVPYGSVGSVQPWGGTDYQPWARWLFLPSDETDWPDLGPGDFIVRACGEVRPWVEIESETVCAQQGAVTYNLARRALRVWERLDGAELVPQPLPRPLRRRAQREGLEIALVPDGMPVIDRTSSITRATAAPAAAKTEPCPLPDTHARLNQSHALWHEALAAYADPDAFVTKLNALIQALRSVTWVMKRELKRAPGFEEWYAKRQPELENEPRLRWLKKARNNIEKRGDLETHSRAKVRIVSGWKRSPEIEFDVDPTVHSYEIARRLPLDRLSRRTREDGLLIVERRWTVEDLEGEEILDGLAWCHGHLARLVAGAHELLGGDFAKCEENDEPCEHGPAGDGAPHPSGRLPCMLPGREERTLRRSLSTLAPVSVEVVRDESRGGAEEARRRYGFEGVEPPQAKDLDAQARVFHNIGRRILEVDGHHLPMAWMWRDKKSVGRFVLELVDERAKYLMRERLAVEVERLGADQLIFCGEVWETPIEELGNEEPQRREAFLTYALSRGGQPRCWRSEIHRDADDAITLAPAEYHDPAPPAPLLDAIGDVWSSWPAA